MNGSRLSGIALCLAAVGVAGCWQTRVKYDGWETFRTQLGDSRKPAPPPRPGGFEVSDPASGWAILLDSFEGTGRYRRAADMMRNLGAKHRLSDLWLHESGQKVHVYRGKFDHVTDLSAQQTLLETRAIEEDGVKPYEAVQFVGLGVGNVQQHSTAMDLRRFSGQGLYTLQIGFYDVDFGDDFRDAAEKAALELRDQGHQAFYFHGANRSMVTVDLFTEADFEQDGPVRVYGPRMLQRQEQFKFNLANGRTIMETFNDGKKSEKRPQQSSVVKVP